MMLLGRLVNVWWHFQSLWPTINTLPLVSPFLSIINNLDLLGDCRAINSTVRLTLHQQRCRQKHWLYTNHFASRRPRHAHPSTRVDDSSADTIKRGTKEPHDMEQPGASLRGIDSSVDRADAVATELGTVDSTLTSPEESKYLLVDDNKVNQKVMTTFFDRLGLKYQTAWNGQEAVDAYQATPQRSRLILLDISMPAMGGMEAASIIRQYEKENKLSPAIIVGLIATRVEDERRRMVVKFGMDTTLVKPIRFDALKELIDLYGKLA